jgi:hypothetical protein
VPAGQRGPLAQADQADPGPACAGPAYASPACARTVAGRRPVHRQPGGDRHGQPALWRALTTFTLVPRRSRIIGAKVAAGALLAAAATVMCVAVTAVVLIAADHGQAGLWQGAGRAIGYAFVFQILNLLLGVGFGLLFHSTPVAIVVYFAAPTAWSILTGTVSALAGTGRWLDPSTAWNHLADGTMTATTWAQAGTAAAAWIALPALAGGWRVLHRPVDV